MDIVVAVDLLTFFLLLWGFFTVWRERDRFFSLAPILPAVCFLSIGRLCDVLVEHPSSRLPELLGLSAKTLETVFAQMGSVADAMGIVLLILGFIKIIKQQQAEEKRIRDLETLLPICANCKKYRTEEGQWFPIEKYLEESGGRKATHGICPDCATKLYGYPRKPKA